MPALVLFGRRWHVATDDFVLPAFTDLLFRLAWLIAVAVIYLKNGTNLNNECEEAFHIKMYLYGVFAILHLIIFFDIALFHNSKSGSVLDEEARKYVPFCIYCRFVFQLAEIAWTTVGTIGIANGKLLCSSTTEVGSLILGLVISNWLLVIIGITLAGLSFDPIGGYKYTVKNNGIVDATLTKEWRRKFRALSCIYSGSPMLKKEAFEEAGYLFASMFEDITVVPSDITAGMILLGLKNEAVKRNKLKTIKSLSGKDKADVKTETNAIEWPKMEKWNSIPVLFHLKKYAMAAYSWPLFLIGHSNPISKLWKHSLCCACMRTHPLEVEGDNCCFLNTSAVKNLTQLDNSDIIYSSFKNPLFENPFFIAVDHPTKSIVIAIRGTLSVNDALVDLNGKPHPLDIPGLPASFKGHHGIARCARILKEKLETLNVLPKLCETYPDYTLALTGTSLGAGTATMLSMMMKADYPNIKCYAYAPPGGLLSLDAAEFCESFVISLVYGDDFVSRVGVYSIETLKYQLIEALNENRTPKYRLFLAECYWLCGFFPKSVLEDKVKKSASQHKLITTSEKKESTVITVDSDPDKDTDDTAIQSQPSISKNVLAVKKPQQFEDLYPPGNILYITETDSFPLGHKKPKYKGEPRWTLRWALRSEFRELLVSRRMVLDHIPFRMYKSLQDFTVRFNDRFGCDLTNNAPVITNVFKKKPKS